MDKTQEATAPQALAPIPTPTITLQGVFENAQLFEHAQRVAICLSSSTMVPDRYRGSDNVGNAVIAIDLAWRIGLPPLMVMQHLFVVYGTPTWSGQMVIALVNGSNRFREPLAFQFKSEKGKDDWGCRCTGKLKATGELIEGPWVDIAMAKAEGWYYKKDRDGKPIPSKWQTIPELMLRYRAAAYFGRTVCPDVTIGLRTREEEEEIGGNGPLIDLPAKGEEPIASRQATPSLDESPAPSSSTAPTSVASGGSSTGPAVAAATEPAAATPDSAASDPQVATARLKPRGPRAPRPAAAPAAPTPPAAAPAPTAPAPEPTPPPAQEPPVETPPPAAQAEPPAEQENPVHTLAGRLHKAGVTVDDFFDWLAGSGRDRQFGFIATDISSMEELPMKLITHLLQDEAALAPCIKIYGPKK